MITHQLSLKAAADIAQVAIHHNPLHWSAKHLNIIYLWFSAMGKRGRNRGIQSYKWNLLYNAECHGICQRLDELIKSRSVHLNRLALWTSICKY